MFREILRIIRAAGYAWDGLKYLMREQKNTRILVTVALLTLIICPLLGFSALQTAMVFMASMLAAVAEVLNTSIEIALDLEVKGQFHPKVKIAKDVASAAVLFSVLTTVTVFFIFVVSNLLNRYSAAL